MLHEFISTNREEIIARCRAKVAARSIPSPSEAEIAHGVPLLLPGKGCVFTLDLPRATAAAPAVEDVVR
jgi:hypothetical protein